MGKNLFVGNLPYTVTEDKLHELFAAHGKVAKTKLIMDKFTYQSRGFGFIEMDNDPEAEEAIKKMNNSLVDGRQIVVKEARPKTQDAGGYSSGGGKRRFSSERSGGYVKKKLW